jgi:hypothetical protein
MPMNNRILRPLARPLLLDAVPGAAAAYSLRQLSNAYTGPVVTVRRSSDNAEADFKASEIDDGTLAAFCGAGDGLVKTWFDQSGNGRHLSNAVSGGQPTIVSSGQTVKIDSHPTLRFDGAVPGDGVGDQLGRSNQSNVNYTDGTGAAMFCAFALRGSDSQYSVFNNAANGTNHRDQFNGLSYSGTFRQSRFSAVGSALPATQSNLLVYSQIVNVSENSHTLRKDFVDYYSGTQDLAAWSSQTGVAYLVGVGSQSDYAVADISELITYGRALAPAEISVVEGNIAWSLS